MPRRSEAGKTSALSEQYVVDSSDSDEGEEGLEGRTTSSSPTSLATDQQQSSNSDVGDLELPALGSKSKKRGHDDSPKPPSKRKKLNSSTKDTSSSSQKATTVVQDPTTSPPHSQSHVPSSSRRKARSQPAPSVARTIPAKTFKPPPGFDKAPRQILPADPIADFLETLEVDGTQLWYITAPTTLPLSIMKEIDLQSRYTEEPIAHHNGVDYHITEPKHSKPRIFFPDSNANFQETRHRVAQTLVIKPAFEASTILMDLVNGTWKPDAARTTPRPTPKQPDARLTYKNRPFGVATAAHESDTFKAPPGAVEPSSQGIIVNEIVSPRKKTHKAVSSSQASASREDAISREERKRKKDKRREREKKRASVEI